MLCDSPLSFFKIRKFVTHSYKKLFPSNYVFIGPVTLANKKELKTVKEIRFPVVQMLKDALFEYEEDFNKIVPDNITIELSGDGIAACCGSNTRVPKILMNLN